MSEQNPIVFMDLRIGEERVGRIVIELYANVVPKTVENFIALCMGDRLSPKTGKPLHYKGTLFHKVVPNVFIQGGDVTNFDGSGGESIFGGSFEDENFILKHSEPGILSSVNSGRSLNTSQFIITLSDCPQLDGSNVVFGKVIRGLACVLQVGEVKIEDDIPQVQCIIENCGKLEWGSPWNYVDCDETDDGYPPDPKDMEIYKLKHADMINILITIRKSGNHFFVKKNYVEADRKYKKALRYINSFTNVVCLLSKSEEEKNEILRTFEKHKITCLINSSASALNRGLHRDALNICDEVLKKEKTNPKVYFWRGKALLQLNDYEAALSEQKKALTLAPNDKCVRREICLINTLIKNYLVEEKKVFSKMFHEFKMAQPNLQEDKSVIPLQMIEALFRIPVHLMCKTSHLLKRLLYYNGSTTAR